MRTTLLAGLLCCGAATAQITPLGGGNAPLFVSGTAQIGTTLQISPFLAPAPIVLLGLTRLDIPLTAFGAGCQDVLVPSLDVTSPVTYVFDVPADPGLIGASFYAQGLLAGVAPCFAGFPFTLTEAVQITIW